MPDPGAPSGPGPGPLPAYFEFAVPEDWRAIDFISDLHLCADMPRTYAAWAEHLQATDADAVFMLGDLFEVWVGDDMRLQPFEKMCMETMAEAACRKQLAFMAGNRDFLLGTVMLRDSGMLALPDPTVINAWGQRVMLSHGDALCLDDQPYQAFRRLVRSQQWQDRFLARSLDERNAIASDMRRQSAASHPMQGFDGRPDTDVDPAEAVRWLHGMGAQEMIHGHTHRPGSSALAPGHKRHVLSDWDLDQGHRAEVLRLQRSGFSRLAPARRG